MKALSVQQPYATLIVAGFKPVEFRSWKTRHRGPLAIHASTLFPPAARALCARDPVRDALRAAGHDDWTTLPLGQVLGVVHLTDCLPLEEIDHLAPGPLPPPDTLPARWAWLLARPARLAVPVPARGRRGLFDLEVPS
jgi:hypothetical protein